MNQKAQQSSPKPPLQSNEWDEGINKQIDQMQIQTFQQQNQLVINNHPQQINQNQQTQPQPISKIKRSRKEIFLSLQNNQPKPLDCQSQQPHNSLSILDDEPGDEVTVVSASVHQDAGYRKRRKRLRKTRQMRAVQIDSKQESVEQIRQQIPKPCIQLEPPEPIPEPFHMTPQQQQQMFQNLYSNDGNSFQNMMGAQQPLTPVQVVTIVTRILMDPNCKIPDMQMPINQMNSNNLSFDSLFQSPMDKVSQRNQEQTYRALATLANSQAKQGQIIQIPKAIAEIPSIIPLLDRKLGEICQQYVMITSHDLITGEQDKFEIRKLIKSNYKQQISAFIVSRLLRVDTSYNYTNVEILKMIKSGYVWDNVIPFMAESLYKDSNLIKVRLLPEKSNSDFVSVLKYQTFLIMCQMFFGLLPRQISTYDLPITFGQIMTLGENDSALTIQNKLAKLKCLLHYFSSVMREKQTQIKNSVEFIAFQRFRYFLKKQALYPQRQSDRVKYINVKLTDHLTVSRVKYGNEYKKEIALYLAHENPARQSGEQSLQTPILMEETYRMMYSKPQIFILKALTSKLDLGQAIIVHGLQQCSKCNWQDESQMMDEMQQLPPRKFVCGGILNQIPDYDIYGKRKGAVILVMSKLLFNQTYIKNDKEKSHRITEMYSFSQLKIEIQALYSAFQGRKNFCGEDQRIVISERYIKFIENDCRWVYFIIVWIASSIAKVKCVFQFKSSEDENEAVFLMQSLEGWSIVRVLEALANYRETLIEAYELWNRYVERVEQGHPSVHNWNNTLDSQSGSNQRVPDHRRVTKMTFLDFLKELYL